MKTGQERRGEMWVLMQARRLGLGRNPLRRSVDRIESALILLAVVVGLLAVPAGAAVGTSVRKSSEQYAAQQRSVLQQAKARTLEDAPAGMSEVTGQVTSRVGVAWQDASGFQREGRTDVYLGTKANTEVIIWLDAAGAIARPPRPAGDSASFGGAAGLGTVMLSWSVLCLLVLAARLPLEKRRLQAWADDWQRVAPLWTRRQT